MKIHPYIALKCELMSLSDTQGAWEDEGTRNTKSCSIPKKTNMDPPKIGGL